jgi:hypothetical protein
MTIQTEDTLSRCESLSVSLRSHSCIRGQWPGYLSPDDAKPASPEGDRESLEFVALRAPRVIVMRSYCNGVTYHRTLILTNKAFAKKLATFLSRRLGETIAGIGDARIDF